MPLLSSSPGSELNHSSRFWLRLIALLPVAVLFAFLIRLPLSWTDQALFSAVLIVLSIVVGRLNSSRSTTLALMVLSIFCTLRYGVWRWISSITYLNNSGWHVDFIGLVFALLLLIAESYAVCILLLGYFQGARPLKRTPVPLPEDTDLWPSVDVYIPTYNEPLEVVRPTVLAALNIDWPTDRINVYLLDDGRRAAFQEFAAECGVGYVTRFDNNHAKAGNINAALKKTHGEYIAIFDCDHIATRSFLQVTMGWFFRDSRLALIQTPHHFYSPDPFERNLNVFRKVPNEGALFYGVVQDGNDLWNATFFCGSCAVIKREALEQIGGIAVETVTEDAHTALRLQRLGWNTAYIGIPQAAGLATGSLSAHVGQRIRWARGMVQILRTECPLFVSGLKFPQRICYLNCVIHYLYAIPRLIFMSAPLVYLIFGKSNLYGYIWEIVAYAAPHLVLSNMVNSRCQGDHRHSFWNEVYEMVLAPYILLPTTFALINPKWGKFNVTAKSSVVEESFFDWKIARPYLYLIALNVLGIALAIPRYFMNGAPSGVLLINVFWAVMNTLLLGASVAVAFESKQRRANVRIEAPLTATLVLSPEEVHHCRVIDLSEGGLALRSERILNVSGAQRALAIVRVAEDEFHFLVETIRTKENRIHLRFLQDDLAHQQAITKLVYARADSWLDWTQDQSRDRILSSLVSVVGIGLHGLWMLPGLLIKRERKEKTPVPGAAAAPSGAKAVLPLLFLLLLLLPHGRALAQVASSRSFEDHQSLADLGQKESVTLRDNEGEVAVSFVLPAAKIVSSASLTLRYQIGQLTGEGATNLVVTLNNVEIAAQRLTANSQGEISAVVALPSELLVHGNTLGLRLRHSCGTTPCKDVGADGPWVQVESSSHLDTAGLVLALPNRLSMLPSPFFDPSVHTPIELPFVFAAAPDQATLQAAGIVGSWYGALADFRGSHLPVSIGQFPAGNVVLLALSDSPIAAQLGLSAASATIAICDNPSDAYGKVLALVGPDSASLVRLAQALALNGVGVDADRTTINALTLPASKTLAPAWFTPGKPIEIAQGLTESLLHVRPNSPAQLFFRLSPELDFGTSISVPLRLNFRLSGLGANDRVTLLVNLNGVVVAQRTLAPSNRSDLEAQSFAIPVSLLYPGNTLRVSLVKQNSDSLPVDYSKLDLQIQRDSTLDLKHTTRFVRMPRLDLFAASGFPFTNQPDLSDSTVVLPLAPSSAQIGLFLDTMAFVSAQTAVPSVRLTVVGPSQIADQKDKNYLLIGSGNNGELFQPFENEMILKPAAGTFANGALSNPPLVSWLNRAWVGRSSEKQKLAALLSAETAPNFLLEEFVSPFNARRTVVVLATKSDQDTQPYFVQLAEESRRGHIHGGLVLAGDKHFYSFALEGRSYTLGENRSVAALYSWLTFHLWIVPLLLIAGAFALAGSWETYLERTALRRLRVGL